MPAAKRLRRYMARVEFLACKETVETMLEQGFSKKLIHERLTEEGRVSMAYITLCQILRKSTRKKPAPRSGIIKSVHESFPDPRKIDPKT